MAKQRSTQPHNWEVYGEKYNPSDPDNPRPGLIEIPQQFGNLVWKKRPKKKLVKPKAQDEEAFGAPLEAMQAVHFIAKGLTMRDSFFDLKDANLTAEEKFAQSAIDLHYGITFDKSMLLKLLSQPKCEGVRSYLCMRPPSHVTLTLIGVDCDGYDLYYDAVPLVKDEAGADNVPTQSLGLEYGYPPGGGSASSANLLDDEHYILLNHARKLANLWKKQNK